MCHRRDDASGWRATQGQQGWRAAYRNVTATDAATATEDVCVAGSACKGAADKAAAAAAAAAANSTITAVTVTAAAAVTATAVAIAPAVAAAAGGPAVEATRQHTDEAAVSREAVAGGAEYAGGADGEAEGGAHQGAAGTRGGAAHQHGGGRGAREPRHATERHPCDADRRAQLSAWAGGVRLSERV